MKIITFFVFLRLGDDILVTFFLLFLLLYLSMFKNGSHLNHVWFQDLVQPIIYDCEIEFFFNFNLAFVHIYPFGIDTLKIFELDLKLAGRSGSHPFFNQIKLILVEHKRYVTVHQMNNK